MIPTARVPPGGAASLKGAFDRASGGILGNPAPSKPQFRAPRNAPRHGFHAVIHRASAWRESDGNHAALGPHLAPHLGHNGLFYGPAMRPPLRGWNPRQRPRAVHSLDAGLGSFRVA